MEVHVTPETAKKLKDLATTSGRAPEDIVEDALAGYLEEVASVRNTLDSRYDDLQSGRVKPIDGEEAFRKVREKSERRRSGGWADTSSIPMRSPISTRFGSTSRKTTSIDRVLADIHSTLTTLAGSPQIGHRRPDLTTRPLRFHVVREYLIAYAPEEKPLWVVGILHGRRNPRLMAAMLRERD
jgi:plasmid stabilization system protein ParE/predicted transcriptional regulator